MDVSEFPQLFCILGKGQDCVKEKDLASWRSEQKRLIRVLNQKKKKEFLISYLHPWKL